MPVTVSRLEDREGGSGLLVVRCADRRMIDDAREEDVRVRETSCGSSYLHEALYYRRCNLLLF